ncbi:MAG TPA: hypothetical protein VM537_33790 [Anaerolineae bacterium]|nr:hypothetical protein [Anaerolineae bacterium]
MSETNRRLAESVNRMRRMMASPDEAVLSGKKFRDMVANVIRKTFGEETGALGDWPDLVDPDTARAVDKVADAVIVLILTNVGAAGHLADYIAWQMEAKSDDQADDGQAGGGAGEASPRCNQAHVSRTDEAE